MSFNDGLMIPGNAQEELSRCLTEGTLVLFLGAGASTALGLPNWPKFVNRLRAASGLPTLKATASPDKLQGAADEVRRVVTPHSAYLQRVKDCLWEGITLQSWGVLRSDLLIALGALFAGSKRGSIRRVVTFNFDSTLEWFLLLHGLVPNVVCDLPALEGSEDVRIYHINGFLPHPSMGMRDSHDILLDLYSANIRAGRPGNPFFEMTRHLLRSGMGLFVGMSERSFTDRSFAPLLTTVGEEVCGRVTGIWLFRNNHLLPL